jgi:exosortase
MVLCGALFAALFARPMQLLAVDWWTDPEAGHGLLLAPLAFWLLWRAGLRPDARPSPMLGLATLAAAVLIRYAAGLAVELFTMRASMVLAAAGIVVFFRGVRQLVAWWLPFLLFSLTIPLPDLIVGRIALPLQLLASRLGAAILESRHVPVELAGNVIRIPGHELFVTEACSGLRSLTSLLSIGVLIGGMTPAHASVRAAIVLMAIPIAIFLNGVRVFLTGYLMHYIGPAHGEGFMHATEGWLMFLAALAMLGLFAWGAAGLQQAIRRRDGDA